MISVVFLPVSVAAPTLVAILATATPSQAEQRQPSHRRGEAQFEELFAAQGCFFLLHLPHFTATTVRVGAFVTGIKDSLPFIKLPTDESSPPASAGGPNR